MSTGLASVGARLRALERRQAETLCPGCPECRQGFGLRVHIVAHDEEDPPFEASCRSCGRAFHADEGCRVIIREISTKELERLGTERNQALADVRARHGRGPEGSN